MGKSTISIGSFSIAMLNYQRVSSASSNWGHGMDMGWSLLVFEDVCPSYHHHDN
jgi:hypothetical protein